MFVKRYLFLVAALLLIAGLVLPACAGPAQAPSPAPSAKPAPAPSPAPALSPAPAPKPTISPTPAPAPKTSIKIGVLVPTTGFFAQAAKDHNMGVDMALKEMNYEIAGRKVEVFFEDTEGKPEVALAKAKRLQERGVRVFMGLLYTNVAYAMKDYAHAQKTPLLISLYAGASDIMKIKPSPYVFRASYDAVQYASPLADWAYKKGYRTMSLFSWDYGAGYEVAGAMARRFIQLGGKILQELYAPMNTLDHAPYLPRIDRSANVLSGFVPSSAALAKQLSEFGIKKDMAILMPALVQHEIIEAAGEAAVGDVMSSRFQSMVDTPEAKAFWDKVYTATKSRANDASEGGYTGVQILAAALKAVNGNIENTDAFVKAMEGVKLTGTPRGNFRFDEYHSGVDTYYISEARKLQWKEFQYTNVPIAKYDDVGQFYPYDPKEYLTWPALTDLKGTWVQRSAIGDWKGTAKIG